MARDREPAETAASTHRKAPRNLRIAIGALIGVVALAAIGSVAARQIRSPAQIAADTAQPAASPISVPVERRALATEVIVRGTVRYGAPQEVVLPVSALKTASPVVSRVPKAGARLGEGAIAAVVSGRPVFVLGGATPMYRDLGPGTEGQDVRQLERALARAGFSPGSIDGRYEGGTASAVSAMYFDKGQAPFGPTDVQAGELRTAAASAAAARDAVLQTRLALQTAKKGALPADISQAEVDAVTAAEAIPVARLAIVTAQGKAETARAAIEAPKLQEAEAMSTANREIALADADVTTKRAAVSDAFEVQAEAQRTLASAPPEATPNERESLRAAVRRAIDAVGAAQANLIASQRAAQSARATVAVAVRRARGEGRRAARELRLAETEIGVGRASLVVAQRKLALARTRVGILRRPPPDPALERRIVASAQLEANRTRVEFERLALRTGVQVPADEVLFFSTLPLRVDSVPAKRGSQLAGSIMTVTNSRLAIDASLSVGDAKLVRRGLRVTIEEQDLRVKIPGKVSRVADKPGTAPADVATASPVDPTRTYVEILPGRAPPSLVGASVKLSIAVKSTKGKVLAVPIAALSVAADGRSRVQVDLGGGKTRFVTVAPGLAAQGFVEVAPTAGGKLKEGDLVVVGSGRSAAAKAPTGVGRDPAPSPGSSPGGSATPGAGAGSTTTTPQSGAGGPATPDPGVTPSSPTPAPTRPAPTPTPDPTPTPVAPSPPAREPQAPASPGIASPGASRGP